MRILELGMTGTIGGIEVYLMNQLSALDHTRFQMDYINDMPYPKLALSEKIEQYGGRVELIPHNFTRHPVAFCKEYRALLRRNHYDAVIANATVYSLKQAFELVIAEQEKVPIRIVHSHFSDQKLSMKGRMGKLVENPMCTHASSKVVTNRFACSEVAGKWLFGEMPFELIRNGINVDQYGFSQETRAAVRKEWGIGEHTLVLGNVGRVSYQKNQSFLIPIVKRLVDMGKDVQLIIVGQAQESDKYAELKKSIEDNHMEKAVRLLGQRDDIPRLLMGMDLFLLPSFYEGLSIAAIEAECTGLPCIYSDKVTKELGLVPHVTYLPIVGDDCVSPWCDAILTDSLLSYDRTTAVDAIKRAGYSIQDETNRVMALLTNMLSK